jgi:ABC-type branched-subunit amino acid transport system permease subunit
VIDLTQGMPGDDFPPTTNVARFQDDYDGPANVDSYAWLKRLVACLFGGLILALMVGSQEGTLNGDFGIAFREAVLRPRVFIFLAIGFVIFLLVSFWPLAVPYLRRPGVAPLVSGGLTALIALTVLNWYDPISSQHNNSRFNTLRPLVAQTSSLGSLTKTFFDWLAWGLGGACLVGCAAAIVLRWRILGYVTAICGIAGAVVAYKAHSEVVDYGNGLKPPLGPDHSLGVYVAVIGFLILAGAGITAVHSRVETATPRAFLERVLNFRPGLAMAVGGVVVGLFAYANDCWYAPVTRNTDLAATQTLFSTANLSSLASKYLSWLGWTLFLVAAVLGLVGTYLVNKVLSTVTVLVSVVGIVTTFFTLHSLSFTGFKLSPGDGQTWGNLGVGGFTAMITFSLFAAGAMQVLFGGPKTITVREWAKEMPVTAMVLKVRRSSRAKSFVVLGLAIALFYPPMLTVTWQNVLVTQIGETVLLAIGLNVVVGWAGLLDLGYIAFYGIGSYTTAYVTGSLPIKPPSWLQVTPLLAIPFAILACLIAGVLLGAPTLRLRGDYLAIVTLGFGEIITVVATNNPGGLTGGPIGPNVPHPVLHIGSWKVVWGEDNLPYWYLLVVMVIIVLVLFYRLEGSRLGRAWAAIREDEVAAQASGVNTMRVKLLAFAIGASTSGLAGVFFATQVGYFDPSLFTLQASILIVAYVVFGGMGSLPGAMAGAAVLTWLPQFLKDQVPPDDRQMWVGAAVLAMMIFRPAGLLPAKRRRAEMEGLEGLEGARSSEVSAIPASGGL